MQRTPWRFLQHHFSVNKAFIILLLTPIILILLVSCGTKGSEANASEDTAAVAPGPEYTKYTELNGKTISMMTGAPFEEMVLSKIPDVREFTYFSSMPDMILALKTKKTDAVLNNNAIASLIINRYPDLALFPQSLKDSVFGLAFDKGSPEREKWQAAYDTISEETKQAVWDKWTGSDESAKVLPAQDWPGKNGTVTAAVCDTLEPLSYTGEGGEIKGFDVEMVLLIARELDVHVDFNAMEFSAILSYVQSGKALLGAGSIIVTDERKQAVDFVEYYPAAFVLVVRSSNPGQAVQAGKPGFFAPVRDSFEKTFIRENRWELFLQGIGTTLLITILAIIFGKVSISGRLVSVIGFTILFGAQIYNMVKGGVDTVDRGQLEAAYSLGYTDRKAFFRIVLPQAIPHIMPSYKGQIKALIKATAIVGYVAVQDLTKMGDIIRSRTYEAFFPLIAVAIIYFVLTAILTSFVNKLELCIDPVKRNRMECK